MRRLTLIAWLACAPLMTACAGRPLALPAAPRVDMPSAATQPCSLYQLPQTPTEADLEIGYAMRGAALAACDAARALAVQTHAAEHALQDQITKARRGSR